jgi:hypothetical protein
MAGFSKLFDEFSIETQWHGQKKLGECLEVPMAITPLAPLKRDAA